MPRGGKVPPRYSRFHCGVWRARGTVRTSTSWVTPAPRSISTTSSTVRVEKPSVWTVSAGLDCDGLGDSDDDLAELLGFLQEREGVGDLGEREGPIHDGPEPAREELPHDVAKLLPVRHRRADDPELAPEDDPDVRLDNRALGGAARHQPPAGGQRADRPGPGGGPDVVEDDVDPALACPLAHGLRPVALAIVDPLVGDEGL